MIRYLTPDEVVGRDHELLVLGVTWELEDFHPVSAALAVWGRAHSPS